MDTIEIGGAKRARRGYGFDEVAIAPSRRTRDPQGVSTSWSIDAYQFGLPFIAAPMDSIVSPESAQVLSELGMLATLNIEGLWGRYADPAALLSEIAALPADGSTARLQSIYSAAPVDPDLVVARIADLKARGITVAVAVSPQATAQLAPIIARAGADIVVIRGTTVSAEHVTSDGEPLNLKQFIYELEVPVIVGGCATHQAALHLMRTGAAGVLVGFGGGSDATNSDVLGVRVPMASAIAEVAAARRDYLDESGGRYVHVIADGGLGRSGNIVKAFACGADAAMLGSVLARASDAPGQGSHWGAEAWHPHLPRGARNLVQPSGTFAEVLHGPSHQSDGTMNLAGA
ncbi:MAG: GuaB3 family IMP dehydrogenase-related protein, partial [Candidatus Nanopelagicales bacterium]|nr:GuaB3 family IMP dehydrogenase-related protein [Candidatus Nanopelagicales bacterium]